MSDTSHKKRVFLASSTEALPHLARISTALDKKEFEPRPWNEEFPNGEFILERLAQIPKEVDFAIFFFAKDVKMEWRGQKGFVTVGNVILEYGLFLSSLGKERVRIIQERGADIPSDLGGLVIDRISDNIELKKAMEGIIKGWTNTLPLNDPYGIIPPIQAEINELHHIIEAITKSTPAAPIKNIIQLTSNLYVNSYTSGLKHVRKRFWTTTYLSSAFWIHKRPEVIESNKQILARIKSVNGTKDVKRLFLLTRSLEEEVNWLEVKLNEYKKLRDGQRRINELRSELDILKENCHTLRSRGCGIRYYYDNGSSKSMEFLSDLNGYFKREDTEIAIYDDFRVDFFSGGRYRMITGQRICAEIQENFHSVKKASEDYFRMAWQKGEDMDLLLQKLEEVFDLSSRKVDYNLKKLMQFDRETDVRERNLKNSEFTFLHNYLINTGLSSNVYHYLDIGTCTGRYPFSLQKLLPAGADIYGIDANADCIIYSDHIKAGKRSPNITFHQSDFLSKGNILPDGLSNIKFELITCMLGTISHFGWNKKGAPDYNDDLQKAIIRMKNLLSRNGILFISNWTENGLRSNMLSIYSANDRNMLASFTEKTSVLVKRLKIAGFRTEVHVIGSYQHLEVIVCRR